MRKFLFFLLLLLLQNQECTEHLKQKSNASLQIVNNQQMETSDTITSLIF